MQNFDKIYQHRIDVTTVGENFLSRCKDIFRQGYPFVLKLSLVGFILLSLQVLAIGVFDRLGVSPKTSFFITSILYVFGLSCLAIIGGVKFAEKVQEKEVSYLLETNAEPICKMLIIRRKGETRL